MYTESKEGSSFKPVFYMLVITLLVILIYFFLTKSSFVFKQGTTSTSTIVGTDNAGGGTGSYDKYFSDENKILIATDSGELKELTIGDTILIETILGDTITNEEIAMEAIEFRHWATNGCSAGQIAKFNGINWVCAEDETMAIFGEITPTPFGGNTTPTPYTPGGGQTTPTPSVPGGGQTTPTPSIPGGQITPTPTPSGSRLTVSVTGTETKTVLLNYDGVPFSTASFIDLNNYITGVTFNVVNGELTFARNQLGPVSVDLDGRYITPNSTNNLTNKSGNISMWTNDVGYLTSESAGVFINKDIDITLNNIIGTPNTVPVFDGDGNMVSSAISVTELTYLAGTTSNIQDQLDSKVPSLRQILTNAPLNGGGDLTNDLTLSIDQATATSDGYLSGTDFLDFSEVNWDEIINATGQYLDYRPNNIQCNNDNILIYNTATPGWLCASFATGNLLADLTQGNGITTFTYDGSAAATVALGPLTANWSQTGAYDIVQGSGTFNNPSASADLYVAGNIENDGTLYANNATVAGAANLSAASSVRIREVANEASAACTYAGEIVLDTTERKVYTCTTAGSPGTWVDIAYAAANSGPGQIVLTSGTYAGNFTYTGGYVGYQAADQICNAQLSGSHMCQTDEIISYLHSSALGGLDGTNAWISEGAPGYTANSNDCSGWTSNNATYLGAFWYFVSAGGGNGALINCSQTKPIACCK